MDELTRNRFIIYVRIVCKDWKSPVPGSKMKCRGYTHLLKVMKDAEIIPDYSNDELSRILKQNDGQTKSNHPSNKEYNQQTTKKTKSSGIVIASYLLFAVVVELPVLRLTVAYNY
jgi:hypothetical protein